MLLVVELLFSGMDELAVAEELLVLEVEAVMGRPDVEDVTG